MIRKACAGVLVVAAIAAGAGCGGSSSSGEAPAAVTTVIRTVTEPATPTQAAPAQAPDAQAETLSQQNARESGESYLYSGNFSRQSLIKQLKYEGFSTRDATYAVDALDPDWKIEAAESAQSYLDTGSFSRSGLIAQLRYEGFTPQQAEYGVRQAGF